MTDLISLTRPATWGDLPIRRPRSKRLGAMFQAGRCLYVRSFNSDPNHSAYVDIVDDDDYMLDLSFLLHDPDWALEVGDTVIEVGTLRDVPTASVCIPARVLKLGPVRGSERQVLSLIDMRYAQRELLSIPRTDVPDETWSTIAELSLSGRPANEEEADRLFAWFDMNRDQ